MIKNPHHDSHHKREQIKCGWLWERTVCKDGAKFSGPIFAQTPAFCCSVLG